MKKFFLLLLILSGWLPAHDIEIVEPGAKRADLGGVQIDSGFYGAPPGNIKLRITAAGPAVIYAGIDGPLASAENFQLPFDGLQWQVYYWTGQENGQPFPGEVLQGGRTNWVPYRRGETPIIKINQAVSNYEIQLGTTVRRIPAVQPNGLYTAKIRFAIDDF
ncbi:MAG: hypothetical protein LBD99_05185 [Candidatus Margulisbacteria bacterium]|jgi:hypothetical protein|nr:hypothetical protein [Candidatus Margulisiibacteriota bacterium]